MKNKYNILSLLIILSLTACQQAKVSDHSTSSAQTISQGAINSINLGTIGNGIPLDVDMNPTPTPIPAPTINSNPVPSGYLINKNSPSLFARFISLFVADASADVIPTPDIYEMFTANQIATQFLMSNSSDYLIYKDIYDSYAASLLSNPLTTMPASLQKLVTVKFNSANNKVASLTLPVSSILDPKSAVILFGSNVYFGSMNFIGSKFVKVGSSFRIIGGKDISGNLNKNIYSVVLNDSDHSFATTILSTITTPNCFIESVSSFAVTQQVATDLSALVIPGWSLPTNLILPNKTLIMSYSNANHGVLYLYLWNMMGNSPTVPILISAAGQSGFLQLCSAIYPSLPAGSTCPLAQPVQACQH